MKIETLKRNHLKRNIIIGVVAVLIISAIILNFTRAKYRVTESIPLVNGKINYSLADLNIVAITVDGEPSDTIPKGNYELASTSYCTYKDGSTIEGLTLNYDSNTKAFSIAPYTTKGTKCYLDFTEKASAGETILANVTVNEGIPNFANAATTDEGVWQAQDNLGTSYYFRGAVTNNYVQFAGYYWRIIRINGDGSIRTIYDGTTAHANGESTNDRQIGTSTFNEDYETSYYVGYTYQIGAQRPSSQNSGTASTIKGVLDNWYQTNIANKGYDDKVVSTPGFCNNREMTSGYNWSATPSSTIYYVAYERLLANKTPILECGNNIDLYTTKIGLIIADEVSMAGGVYRTDNTSYYLYTGQNYWTMTPYYFLEDSIHSYAYVVVVISTGSFGNDHLNVNGLYGVRPVINLSSNVIITGSGTISDPYVVN